MIAGGGSPLTQRGHEARAGAPLVKRARAWVRWRGARGARCHPHLHAPPPPSLPNGSTAPRPERQESFYLDDSALRGKEGPRRRTKKEDQVGGVPQYRSTAVRPAPGISMKTVRVDGEESRSLPGASGHRFTGGRRGAVRPAGRPRSPSDSVQVSVCLFHSFTLSLSHSQSLCHSVNLSLCHSLTLSLFHSLTLSLFHSLTLSLFHSLTLSLSHSLTLSFVSLDSSCSFFITLLSWFLLVFTERVHWVLVLILINYELIGYFCSKIYCVRFK